MVIAQILPVLLQQVTIALLLLLLLLLFLMFYLFQCVSHLRFCFSHVM